MVLVRLTEYSWRYVDRVQISSVKDFCMNFIYTYYTDIAICSIEVLFVRSLFWDLIEVILVDISKYSAWLYLRSKL